MTFSKKRKLRSLVLIFGLLGLLAGTGGYFFRGRIKNFIRPLIPVPKNTLEFVDSHGFLLTEISTQNYRLFDLGVVDVEGDGSLDIFTSNHYARQSLLINKGDGSFVDRLSALNLDQDPHFPGIEDSTRAPDVDAPGLFVYFQNQRLCLEAFKAAAIGPIAGKLRFMVPIKIERKCGFTTITKRIPGPADVDGAIVEFVVESDGILEIKSIPLVGPISLSFEPRCDLRQVRIGQQRIRPAEHSLTLNLGDRHGMAWADVAGDADTDVFIVNGGLTGLIGKLPLEFFDELMVRRGAAFIDATADSGLRKGARRPYKVAWVDVDGDGRLDAHVDCLDTPNQLFIQGTAGKFVDVAPSLGLDTVEIGAFIWIDADHDADMDLVAVEGESLVQFLNDRGSLTRRLIEARACLGIQYFALGPSFSAADFDLDGDIDLFVSSQQTQRALLLENVDGDYYVRSPTEYGLPKSAITAVWVDYDNDGLVDLHAIPGGLYRHLESGRFEQTRLLKVKTPVFDARCTWADLDNDGRRDPLFAIRVHRRHKTWHVAAYQNTVSSNHWLQIKLVGPPGNREAIGARVSVMLGRREVLQHVGAAEGSHYSQGHYRLYFGLGPVESVDVRVTWPSGESQEFHGVKADRLITIEHDALTGARE